MSFAAKLDYLHARAVQYRWLWYFAIFNRSALALGFLPSGFVKVTGERFTSLSNNHPMGQYLEALHHTGYYYTFIGVLQITAAVLLLIPRTAILGALLYFPIILNICILSLAVRFDGSLISSPLMVLANLYLLCWDYDKLKYIMPFHESASSGVLPDQAHFNYKFPTRFFAGAGATVIAVVLFLTSVFEVKPRNTLRDCRAQFNGNDKTAGYQFCDCIHINGQPLDKCLDDYNRVANK